MALRKYRWKEWLRPGLTTVLIRDEHYHCSQSTMTQMLRNEASKRKVRVRLKDEGDAIIVEVSGAIPHTNKTTITS